MGPVTFTNREGAFLVKVLRTLPDPENPAEYRPLLALIHKIERPLHRAQKRKEVKKAGAQKRKEVKKAG